MKKFCLLIAGMLAASILAGSASALPPIDKEFKAKYVESGSAGFKAAAGEAKCNVCHKGSSKKDKNEYGVAVAKFLKKDEVNGLKDNPDAQKKLIAEGLTKAEAEKNGAGKTFGELIKAGMLPGGTP